MKDFGFYTTELLTNDCVNKFNFKIREDINYYTNGNITTSGRVFIP